MAESSDGTCCEALVKAFGTPDCTGLPSHRSDSIAMRMLIRSGLLAALLFALAALPAFAQSPSPVGQWRTIDDETSEPRAIVEIYEEDGSLYGRIVEILKARDEAPRNDEGQIICTACEGEKENQPVEGLVIIEDMEQDGSRWSGGTILDPENGKAYKARMELEGEDRLKVRGYIGLPLLGRTQTWYRVPE